MIKFRKGEWSNWMHIDALLSALPKLQKKAKRMPQKESEFLRSFKNKWG
jgi:hypothetical protein